MPRRARAKQSNELLPVIMIVLGAVLVVAVLIWQVVQSSAGGSAAVFPTQAAAIPADIPEPGIERISVADARAALNASAAVFLDVRDPVTFQTGHIPGAINIPINELEARVGELDPAQWIITYCT
jgi:hypothetical protein